MILTVGDNVAEMLQPPCQQRIQMGHETLSAFAELVFHSRRNFCEHLATDNAIVFKMA